jgi:hypothetical protein
MRALFALAPISALFFLTPPAAAQTKVYRGSVGNSHVQMRLTFNGANVSGTYAYDSVGEDLKLTGTLTADGKLELKEFDAKKKQSGKFICKRPLDDPIDPECMWSKPDGTREAFVRLEEQYIATTEGLEIAPKTITNRKTSVTVSYPQIITSGALAAAAQKFNRRVLAMVQKEISEFQPIDGKGTFDTNYNVLLGTNDLVSIELSVYFDGGGAHPNNYFHSLTYDLKADKELSFEDLFIPNTDYNAAIAKFVVADIDKRAAAMEARDRPANQQPAKREGPLISEDQLGELSGWGMTPKGLVIYFDFPHVIAAFDKNVVPYQIVREYLKPNGPAARFQ